MDFISQTWMLQLWTLFLTLIVVWLPNHHVQPSKHKHDPRRDTSGNFSNEYYLLYDLFYDYDQGVRPRYDSNESVLVAIRFSLQQIYDLDEKRQVLTISGWLTAEWHDEYLMWDPADYGGVSKIVVDPRDLWTPKLAIGNSADRMFHAWKHFWITVRHNGMCRWQPGGNFAFTCALDMNYYPFDEQKCTMEIETWYYTADKVNLTNSMTQFGLETYISHGEWAVVNTNVSRKDVIYTYYKMEAFPEVYFSIQLRRKYTFYFMYILLPCIMLSFVLLMIFLLPAESGEKVSLGVSILVSFSVFLIIVAEQVPDTSDAVPVIAIYLMYFMMATALSVMSSTLILKLHYRGLDKEPPHWLRVLMFDLMAPFLCLGSVSQWSRRHRKCLNLSNGKCITEQPRKKNAAEGRFPCSNSLESVGQRLASNEQTTSPISHSNNTTIVPPCEDNSNTCVTCCNNESANYQACTMPGYQHIAVEWQKVSEVLDRFFFWTFLIFIMMPLVSLVGFIRVFSGKM